MPELPEVQTIIEDLSTKVLGTQIQKVKFITRSVWRKRVPSVKTLAGASLRDFQRSGKHILLNLSNGHTMIVHLKMTGKLTFNNPDDPVAKHTHLVIKLDKGELRFNDIRRFGFLDYRKTSSLPSVDYLNALGPDALSIDRRTFIEAVRDRNRAIKSVLLDQTVISGLGNIYSDEALYAAGINPARKANDLDDRELARLHGGVVRILKKALDSRGSSISDYVDGIGRPGKFQNFHKVYGRTGKPCKKCHTKIEKVTLSGRSSHFCPVCQR